MQRLRTNIAAVLILGIAGCAGGTGSPSPVPSPTPAPVTFHQSGGFSANPPDSIYVVQGDGVVTKTLNGSSAGTAKLTIAQTAKLYADLQNALPLSSLPASSVPDSPSITVTWQGQTSPDIFGGGNAREQALLTDLSVIEVALP